MCAGPAPAAFDAVADTDHHYSEGRALADMVPEATLRMAAGDVAAAYPSQWRELVGVKHPLSP